MAMGFDKIRFVSHEALVLANIPLPLPIITTIQTPSAGQDHTRLLGWSWRYESFLRISFWPIPVSGEPCHSCWALDPNGLPSFMLDSAY
jgi:hypothetical protein